MRRTTVSIEHGLLGFLRPQPKHGYAIHQTLSDPAGLGLVWQIKLSRLYALLGKLEAAGYIITSTEPQGNKPPRKLYHLTAAGETAFFSWLNSPVNNGRSLRLEFLVKLYFARREDAVIVPHLLTAQRAQCHAWLLAEQANIDAGDLHGLRYGRLVHQFRLGQIEAMLTWLDECEQAYEQQG